MKEKYIQVGGRKVAYLSVSSHSNDKATSPHAQKHKIVFLLHGWGGSKESWTPLLDKLVTELVGKTFIAVDFPGFGDSEEPPHGWNVEDYARWFEHFVAAIYKENGLSEDYEVIVHSFGGRVLLKLFANNFRHGVAARPDRLVLIAAAGVKHGKSLRVRVAGAAARAGKAVMNWPVLRRLAPLAQKILYKALRTHDYEKTSGVMRETFLKVIDEDLRNSILEIHRPTLIIWGDRDSYVPVKDAYLMHKEISGSELHIIEGGKHGIHKTHTDLVANLVRKFINK